MRQLLPLVSAGLVACSGSEATIPPVSLVEGTWVGAITGDAQDGLLEWRLTDTGGAIGGEGELTTASATVRLSLEGIYEPPGLSLTIHAEGYEDISFAGTVAERIIKGRMTGAGLVNRTVTLDRQE